MIRLRGCLALLFVLALPFCLDAGERYAFLVAVQQYEDTELRPLKYTDKDIEDLARLLIEVGYKPANIVVMTEGRGRQRAEDRPDAANISRRMKECLERLTADDTLLAALSGHGVQFPGRAESYFCPAAADLAKPETLLPLDRLYESMVSYPGLLVLLVDACRSDPQLAKSPTIQAESITRPPPPPGGIASLFSCSEGQQSFEHQDLQHGVFFHYVIEGLRGKADSGTADLLPDGNITLPELENYVAGQVQQFVRDRLRREQRPQRRGDTRGLVSLATLGARPAQAPQIAEATFDSLIARRRQQEWADFLGTPISQTNNLGMELVLIPPGKFMMGSSLSAEELAQRFGREAGLFQPEFPLHAVEVPEPYYLCKYEVTLGQFRTFVSETGYQSDSARHGGYVLSLTTGRCESSSSNTWSNPGFSQDDSHPVVLVSWNDAVAFCQWLSKRTSAKYRLPTEAEWEHACRAGTTSLYCNGSAELTLPKVANLADASANLVYSKEWDDGYSRTAPVGKFDPNAFGLHDVHGNVYEWCSNAFAKYGTAAPIEALRRTTRGGSWESLPAMVRCSLRLSRPASWCCDATGFRVVLVPQPNANSRRSVAP